MATVKELFSAYQRSELPEDGGYIVCSFFDPNSTYTRYDVTSYNNVKDIYNNDDGLTFLADGKKIFLLVEPSNYAAKHVEPANRDDSHRIPYRFKELEIFTSKRQDRVMLGTKPIVSMGSFTILKPRGNNFAYIFYNTEDVIEAVRQFFYKSLWEDSNVPRLDAEKISTSLVGIFEGLIEFEVA